MLACVSGQARLERSEAQARMLGEASEEKDKKVKAAARRTEELQSQVRAVSQATIQRHTVVPLLLLVFLLLNDLRTHVFSFSSFAWGVVVVIVKWLLLMFLIPFFDFVFDVVAVTRGRRRRRRCCCF